MNSDNRIEYFRDLEPERQMASLPFLDKSYRVEVLELSSSPEETVGGIMSTDFATVRIDMTLKLDAPEVLQNNDFILWIRMSGALPY